MGAIAVSAKNGNVLYAGTGEANFSGDSRYGVGVLKSTNGGASWRLVGNSVFNRKAISKIAIDPSDPNIAYAASAFAVGGGTPGNFGLWKTIDGGAVWTNTTTSLGTNQSVADVVIDPVHPNVVYCAIGGRDKSSSTGVYKSINGGGSWTAAGDFPSGDLNGGKIVLALAASSPRILYAVQADHNTGNVRRVMKSIDAGVHWTALVRVPDVGTQFSYDMAISVDPHNAKRVFISGQHKFIETIDGGLHWSDITSGTGVKPYVDRHAMAFDATGHLISGQDGGVSRLDNPAIGHIHWADLNSNLETTQFMGLALHPTDPNIVWGGSQDTGTDAYSGSLAWHIHLNSDGGVPFIDQSHPNIIYGALPFPASSGFQRSDDGGKTFASKVQGINFKDPTNEFPPVVMDPSNSSRLIFATSKLYVTSDRADHWTPLATPGINGFNLSGRPISAVAIAPSDSRVMYVSSFAQDIYVKLAGDNAWHKRNIPFAHNGLNEIQVDPTNPSTAYVTRNSFNGGGSSGHVFRTTNAGLSWEDLTGNLPDTEAFRIRIGTVHGQRQLYLATDAGVYSSSGSATWTRFGRNLPNAQVWGLEINQRLGILAAATHGRGAWEIKVPKV